MSERGGGERERTPNLDVRVEEVMVKRIVLSVGSKKISEIINNQGLAAALSPSTDLMSEAGSFKTLTELRSFFDTHGIAWPSEGEIQDIRRKSLTIAEENDELWGLELPD